MLVARLIEDIIDNYNKQQQLYERIAALSCAQLNLLSEENWLGKQDELNDLLKKRQQINEEIDILNSQNKILQEQVIRQTGISEFALSHLESQLEVVQHKSLSDVVAGLGDILANISKIDEQNHVLMKKKAGPSQIKPKTNSQQAQNAYKQAGRQSKKR